MSDKNQLQASIRRVIRVKKQDSAFVYFLLESYEGITSYSTLNFRNGDLYRDLELRMSSDFVSEVEKLLRSLGDLIYEIQSESRNEGLWH